MLNRPITSRAELWPGVPIKICQFHAIREAGRLIYNADHRVKTDMRISMQEERMLIVKSAYTSAGNGGEQGRKRARNHAIGDS